LDCRLASPLLSLKPIHDLLPVAAVPLLPNFVADWQLLNTPAAMIGV
jgi:hypothetical protein